MLDISFNSTVFDLMVICTSTTLIRLKIFWNVIPSYRRIVWVFKVLDGCMYFTDAVYCYIFNVLQLVIQ